MYIYISLCLSIYLYQNTQSVTHLHTHHSHSHSHLPHTLTHTHTSLTITHTHTLLTHITHPHTCSEQSLRILMWNVSYVQKTLQLNLTGKGRWQDPRRIEMEHIHLNQIVLLLLTAEKYRLRKPYRHWDDMEWKLSVWVWFWRNLKKESARWFDASEPDVQRFFRAQVLGVGERNLILLKKHG